jgi:SET domain-containing protein
MSRITINHHLFLHDSPIHGSGVFARRDIPKGTLVIQYTGEIISKQESDRRAEKVRRVAEQKNTGAVYIFTLNDDYDLDGNVFDNYARFINHACKTNCEAVNIDDEIWIETTRKIKKGEELHYDYGFDYSNWHEHPCRCGKKACVGFIVDKKYREKIMKTKKYEKLMRSK